MRYWWVSQNKTYRQEVGGGLMWAPKRRTDGTRYVFYDNMREVSPGDVIFSFCHSKIAAVGIAISPAYDCIMPEDFPLKGHRWDQHGWRIDVKFIELRNRVCPREHISLLAPLLPPKNSPLQQSGRGNMSYLFSISRQLAEVLGGLIGEEAQMILLGTAAELARNALPTIPKQAPVKEWEDHLQDEIQHDAKLKATEKKALVTARVGQGIFKANVQAIEDSCRITGVRNLNHLIGSHIKPWRHSDNQERLDGENGLLLTPSIDHLFDKGHISFKDTGALLISPIADRESLAKMGVRDENSVIVKPFTHIQQRRLEFHRDAIFLRRAQ
jgi:hypothetical protein